MFCWETVSNMKLKDNKLFLETWGKEALHQCKIIWNIRTGFKWNRPNLIKWMSNGWKPFSIRISFIFSQPLLVSSLPRNQKMNVNLRSYDNSKTLQCAAKWIFYLRKRSANYLGNLGEAFTTEFPYEAITKKYLYVNKRCFIKNFIGLFAR